MCPIPREDFPHDMAARLEEYLAAHPDESESDIADSGPQAMSDGDARALLWLFCAFRTLNADPGNGFQFLRLASVYLGLGRPNEARQVYLALKDLRYAFLGYYDHPDFHLGWLEADLGNFETALHHLAACAQAYPEQAWNLFFYRGTVYHEMGRFDDAALEYQRYVQELQTEALKWLQKPPAAFAEALGKMAEVVSIFVQTASAGALVAVRALMRDAEEHRPFRGRRQWPIADCGVPEAAACLYQNVEEIRGMGTSGDDSGSARESQ